MWGGLRIGLAVCLAIGFASSAQAGWLLFESPGHGFAALFPRAPAQKEHVQEGMTMTTFRAGNDGAQCSVIVGKYDRAFDAANEIASIHQLFVKAAGATETAAKAKTLMRGASEANGIEFDAASDKLSFRSVIVAEGLRIYQVVAAVSKIDGDTAELEACAGGFRLLPL